MGVTVIGLNSVIVSFAKASALAKLGAPAKVEEVCAHIEETAKSIVPVRGGSLRDSISHEVTKGFGTVTGEVGPTEYYGQFVEFGTSVMAPEAFMGPALDRHSHELEEAIAELGDI